MTKFYSDLPGPLRAMLWTVLWITLFFVAQFVVISGMGLLHLWGIL